jgi:hypothetical protein
MTTRSDAEAPRGDQLLLMLDYEKPGKTRIEQNALGRAHLAMQVPYSELL